MHKTYGSGNHSKLRHPWDTYADHAMTDWQVNLRHEVKRKTLLVAMLEVHLHVHKLCTNVHAALIISHASTLPLGIEESSMKQIRRLPDDNARIIFVSKNICCGYSLESPRNKNIYGYSFRRGDSNEYLRYMFFVFFWEISKIIP